MPSAELTVNLTWTAGGGSPGTNTWHLRSTGEFGPGGDFGDLSLMIRDFYTDCQAFFPNDLNIQMFGELRGILGDEGKMTTVDSWGLAGSAGSNHLPNANALCATWRGDTGGRSGRGRTFLGPIGPATATTVGQPTAGTIDTLQDAINTLVESSDSFDNGAIAIYSRKDNILRDITSGKASPKFAVLRSRRD